MILGLNNWYEVANVQSKDSESIFLFILCNLFNTFQSHNLSLVRKYLIFVSCLWMIQFTKESTYIIFKQEVLWGFIRSSRFSSEVVWFIIYLIYWYGSTFVRAWSSVWVLGDIITLQGVGMRYNIYFIIKFQVYILYSWKILIGCSKHMDEK